MRYIGKFYLMILLPTKSISKILAFYLSTRLGYKESGEIRYCRLVLQIFLWIQCLLGNNILLKAFQSC